MIPLALLTWLSPAFPVGAFAYSGGLEAAVSRGVVTDADELADWLDASLHGSAVRSDAIALALAARGRDEGLDELVVALAGSPTRERELRGLGAALSEAALPWRDDRMPLAETYPVALGQLCRMQGIAGDMAASAFALAAVTNAVQAAQRLLAIGQRDGVRIVAALHPAIERLGGEAARATTDDLFTATPIADLCALAHPTVEPRLFRS